MASRWENKTGRDIVVALELLRPGSALVQSRGNAVVVITADNINRHGHYYQPGDCRCQTCDWEQRERRERPHG